MPVDIDERLNEIEARYKAAKLAVGEAEPANGRYECPLCHGDGDVEECVIRDMAVGYAGVQVFGVGKQLAATDDLIAHLDGDLEYLIARLRDAEAANERLRELLRECVEKSDRVLSWANLPRPDFVQRCAAAITPPQEQTDAR